MNMHKIKGFLLLTIPWFAITCNNFKFDPDTNCFNPGSSCFVKDTQAPTLASSVPAAAGTVQQNSDIQTVVFSEPVNGADKPSSYVFSGAGGANIVVSVATKVDDRTYQLTVSGGLITGAVVLSFPGVTDWAGNAVQGTLSFTASVGIVVTIAPSGQPAGKYYISNTAGGNLTQSFTWQSDTVAEQYFVNIVPFASPCPAAPVSSNSTGTGNSGVVGTANSNITTQIKAADMAGVGDYNICIFVNKTSAPVKTGSGSVVFTRDDSKPVISSIAPASSASVNNTVVSYTVSEACATGSVTWTRTGGSADGMVHTQALTGAELNTGVHSGITLTNNPVLVNGAVYSVAFGCIDLSLNAAVTVTSTNVTYDSTAPIISAVSPVSSSFGNTTVSYTFSEICASGSVTWTRTGGTADGGSPHVQALSAGELAAGAHTAITLASSPVLVSGSIYSIAFDCTDLAANVASTVTSTNVTVDNTAPIISAVAPASSSFRNNTIISYTVSEACASGNVTWTRTSGTADGSSPHVQALVGAELNIGAHSSITLTNNPALVSGSVYAIAFNCTDAAGNAATTVTNTNITFDNIAPVISAASPATNAIRYDTIVSYTLSETAASGSITWTRSGGNPDGGSPHVQALTAAEMIVGAHTNIILSNNPALVTGTIYSIAFDATDLAGNIGTTVTSTNVTKKSTTATRVYGQLGSFTTSAIPLTADGLNQPTGVAVDAGGVYISDSANNRVLYYAGTSTTATRVYGQLGSFTTGTVNNGGVSADSFDTPMAVAVDASGVYIADYWNNRVLFYPGTSTTATRVYGQAGNFTTNTFNNGGLSANSLGNPSRIALDASGVYIVDYSNHRALFYAGTSTTATRVYGQLGSFTTGTQNNGGITANSLRNPNGIAVDASGVYIADNMNHRVLFYSGTATTATRVYGQLGSFTTATANNGGVTANALNSPYAVALDATGVYIAAYNNNRVLYYSGTSTTGTAVFGQLSSFTSQTANNGGLSADSLYNPYGLAVDATGLYIVDNFNQRVLFY